MSVHYDFVNSYEEKLHPITVLKCAYPTHYSKAHNAYVASVTCKTYGKGFTKTSDYESGTWFEYHEVLVNDLKGLSTLLLSIQDSEFTCIIRGELIDLELKNGEGEEYYVRRTSSKAEGKTPYFQSVPEGIHWCMFDLDNIEPPKGLNIVDNTIECVEYAVSLLPDYFHNASYHVQLSSSAGADLSKIKLHLFFWFKDPVKDLEIKTIAVNVNNGYIAKVMETFEGDPNTIPKIIDVSVLHATQPHYTSAPKFEDANDDPFKHNRSFLVGKKNDCVEIPDVAFNAIKEKVKIIIQNKNQIFAYNQLCKVKGLKHSQWYVDALAQIGLSSGYNGIYKAAYAYASQVGVDLTDANALKKDIVAYVESLDEDVITYDKNYLLSKCEDSSINLQIENAINAVYSKEKAKKEKALNEPDKEVCVTTAKKYKTVEEGQVQVVASVNSYFDDPKDTVICMTSGAGKTTQAVKIASTKHIQGLVGDLYVQNHASGFKLRKDLEQLKTTSNCKGGHTGAVVLHPYSRDYEIEDTEEYKAAKAINPNHRDLVWLDSLEQDRKMCYCKEAAKILSDKGVSIYPKLCFNRVKTPKTNPVEGEKDWYMKEVKCDYYHKCGYIKQYLGDSGFESDGFGGVRPCFTDIPEFTHRILMSTVLGQEESTLIPGKADYAISDESISAYLIGGTRDSKKGITFDELDKMPLSKALKIGLKNADPELPLFQQIRTLLDQEELVNSLDAALKMLKEKEKSINFIGMPLAAQIEAAKNTPNKDATIKCITALKTELIQKKDHCNSLTRKKFVNSKTKEVTYLNAFTLQFRKHITRLSGVPLLALDADYTPLIHNTILDNPNIVTIELDRKIHLMQVYDKSVSKSRIVADEDTYIKGIQKLIDSFGDTAKVFVCGPQLITGNVAKGVPAKIKVNAVSWLAHYGNQRGFDHWKSCDVEIIISDNNPPTTAVIEDVRGLFYDSNQAVLDDPKLMQKVKRKYATKTGFTREVDIYEHADPRVQEYLESKRECEVIQAVDRGRHIHTPSAKLVIVLASVPLDRVNGLVPDNLITLSEAVSRETRLSKVLNAADGCLPLSIKYLTEKHPDMGTGKDWDNYFQREVEGTNLPALRNASLLSAKESEVYSLYEYKTKGSGQATKCLSKYDFDETLSRLSAMVPIVKLIDKTTLYQCVPQNAISNTL